MRSSTLIAVRRAAYFSLPAGVLATGLAFSTPSSAASIADPGHGAAHYLAGQLAAGGDRLLYDPYEGKQYDNLGGTADAIMGLAASGTSKTAASRATAYLAKNLANYIGSGTELYAGATAKALLLTSVEGVNPRTFGGVDLIGRLTGLETSSGRFSDQSAYPDGDYSNGIGQSLAVLALKRAGQNPSTASVDYLLKQQCANGGFQLTLDDPKGCTADADTTGYAVQALVAAGGHSTAVAKAASYLGSQQNSSGAIGTDQTGVANSTGLAAMAFTVAGDNARATKARSYLTTLQYGCTTPAALRGGLAANAAILADKTKQGAAAKPNQSDDVATAQGIVGLVGASYVTVSAGSSSASAPADQCSSTTSPTSTATVTPTSTSTVTGPPVITDGPESGSSTTLLVGALAAGGAIVAGGAGARRFSRRAGRH